MQAPRPAEEKLTRPGCALARASRSGSDLIGESGATEITIGYSMTVLTMPKSRTGSYGSFFITAAVRMAAVSSTIVWPSAVPSRPRRWRSGRFRRLSARPPPAASAARRASAPESG